MILQRIRKGTSLEEGDCLRIRSLSKKSGRQLDRKVEDKEWGASFQRMVSIFRKEWSRKYSCGVVWGQDGGTKGEIRSRKRRVSSNVIRGPLWRVRITGRFRSIRSSPEKYRIPENEYRTEILGGGGLGKMKKKAARCTCRFAPRNDLKPSEGGEGNAKELLRRGSGGGNNTHVLGFPGPKKSVEVHLVTEREKLLQRQADFWEGRSAFFKQSNWILRGESDASKGRAVRELKNAIKPRGASSPS